MYLKELIAALVKEDPSAILPRGFRNPHSYRGYYDRLAFEPAENISIGEMLECAESALGRTFQGYKGGDYVMGEYTEVYIAEYGCCGEEIGPRLLSYMLETR